MPPNSDVQALALRDRLRVVRQRWWVVAVVVLACTSVAFAFSFTQTPLYTATASIMYQEPANIADPLGGGSDTSADDLALKTQSVVNTIDSPDVTDLVRKRLSGVPSAEDYEVTAEVMAPESSSGGTMSDVVAINAVGEDPAVSAEVANAYADAVIETRIERERVRLSAAQDVIRRQMERFTTEAAKLSTDYLLLAERLTELQVAEAATTGDFLVIRPAIAPDEPSSPKPRRTAALAFGVSLLAGIALAFLLDQVDSGVRTHREVGATLALPVIGRVPHASSSALRGGDLVTLADEGSLVAEAIRTLRGNLAWQSLDGEWKSLLVTSSAKGEGKTFIVCNLAVVLAQAGKNVVLVDADLRRPAVHREFSLPNRVGLTSCIKDGLPVPEALQSVPFDRSTHVRISPTGGGPAHELAANDGSLRVLTSGPLPPNPGEVVASGWFAGILGSLMDSTADYVLVDAPPLLGVGDVAALALITDAMLFVTNVSSVSMPMLEDARHALDALPCRKLGVVTVGERLESSKYNYGYGRG